MNTQVLFALTLAFLFAGAHAAWNAGAHAATVTFTNKCTYTVWPGTLTGNQKTQLSRTGFELAPGANKVVNLPAPWSGRFWGRTRCADKNGRFTCATADCGSGQVACNGAGPVQPVTLVELTVAENNGKDSYDVSLVDGFNLPMSVSTQGGKGDCKTSSCPAKVNANCPAELQLKGSDGNVIACKSACFKFNQVQYCCKPNDTPKTCPPTYYSMIFKKLCPQAYSYAKDDVSSTFTCSNRPSYEITFCPQA